MGYQPTAQQDDESLTQPVTDKNDLIAYFIQGFKKHEEVRIGMEVEKHGIHKSSRSPITHLEQNGLKKIQEKLIEELDWKIERQEGKYITSMMRGGSRLTLEICESMSELSGRTHPSIHDLARELRIHQHELSEMSNMFDVVWLGMGHQPLATNPELRTLKIKRFKIWEDYIRKKSPKIWEDLTKKNASLQANIDYISEDDARKKFQILLKLAPFLSAMYANSPLKDGKLTGFISYRTHLLQQIDRRRYGIRKLFFSKKFGFEDWTDFCMSVPMIVIIREGKWIPVKKLTFTQFMKSGYEGYMPTMEDWIMHLSFIYTDVRIKKYIELRVCDSLPPFLIPSMQAIVKAFVYHKDGESMLESLTKEWGFRDFSGVYRGIAKEGMQAQAKGKKMLDYCKEILNFATENLRSFNILNEKQEDESVHLQPIKDFVFVKEKSPGRFVADNWDGEWKQNPERLIEWCSFEQL